MDDAERVASCVGRLVRGVQAMQRVDDDRCGDLERYPLAALFGGGGDLAEGIAVDVLHDENELVGRSNDVERRDHGRVVDAGGEAGLASGARGPPRPPHDTPKGPRGARAPGEPPPPPRTRAPAT